MKSSPSKRPTSAGARAARAGRPLTPTVASAEPSQAPVPASAAEIEDVAMPTVENERSYQYVPGQGCSILDNFEISLAFLLDLSNNKLVLPKGALRQVLMEPGRFAQLSDSAQKWMRQQPDPKVTDVTP